MYSRTKTGPHQGVRGRASNLKEGGTAKATSVFGLHTNNILFLNKWGMSPGPMWRGPWE